MNPILQPWVLMVLFLASWINRQQRTPRSKPSSGLAAYCVRIAELREFGSHAFFHDFWLVAAAPGLNSTSSSAKSGRLTNQSRPKSQVQVV